MRRPLCLAAGIFVLAMFAAMEAGPPPAWEGRQEWDGERVELVGTVEDMTWPVPAAVAGAENAAGTSFQDVPAASAKHNSYEKEPEAVLDLAEVKYINFHLHHSDQIDLDHINTGQNISNQIKLDEKLHIICYLKKPESGPMPKIGERVRIEGEVRLFRRGTNPGEFDAAEYYRNRGYLFQVTDGRITGRGEEYSAYRQLLYRIRAGCAQVVDTHFSPQDASVLKAMLLGDKKGMDQEIKELYQQAGIAHVLAISGLHVSLLGLGVYRILKKARLPCWLAAVVSTLLLWSFIVMTGFSPSSVRAFTMFLLSMGALVCGRTYDSATALCAAAVVCLAGRPLELYDAGFRLSFTAAAGAVFTVPALKRLGSACAGTSGRRMGERERGVLETKAEALLHGLREAFLASLGISLTTLPVMLWTFREFNWLSIAANCLVIPLMSLLMGGLILVVGLGAAAIGAGAAIPVAAGASTLEGAGGLGAWITRLVDAAALPVKGILRIYEKIAGMTASSGFGIWHAGCPAVWQVAVFCAGLLLFVLFAKRIRKAVGAGFLCALCLVFAIRPFGGTELTMLDVGQGDCFFLKTETNRCYLIDAGSTSKKDTGTWQVVPFLKYRGVGRLEGIFVSHWDEDHVNGLEAVCRWAKEEGVGIGRILLPDTPIEDEALSRLLETARLYGIGIERLKRGDRITDGRTTLTCLHPYPGEEPTDRNASSMVLKLTCPTGAGDTRAFSALLTGDIEAEGEEWMLSEEARLLRDCDLLKAAHHGSDTSTVQAFADCVSPSIVLVSCGAGNRYGHPSPAVMERLKEAGSRVYITKDCGAVTVRIRNRKVTVSPFLQVD